MDTVQAVEYPSEERSWGRPHEGWTGILLWADPDGTVRAETCGDIPSGWEDEQVRAYAAREGLTSGYWTNDAAAAGDHCWRCKGTDGLRMWERGPRPEDDRAWECARCQREFAARGAVAGPRLEAVRPRDAADAHARSVQLMLTITEDYVAETFARYDRRATAAVPEVVEE